MTTRHYIASCRGSTRRGRCGPSCFPDFPGVTSTASDFPDVPQQARDALATAVEDMIAEGEHLPASVEEGGRAEVDTDILRQRARSTLCAVEMPEALGRRHAASAPRFMTDRPSICSARRLRRRPF